MSILGSINGIGKVVEGIGGVVKSTSEVFHANETQKMQNDADRFQASLKQYSAEYTHESKGNFASFVNGLNRLPRPFMALGTVALFIYAMSDPEGFKERMVGLQFVPEPLWWLLGAVVSFYFGARELHHFRARSTLKHSSGPLPTLQSKPLKPKPKNRGVENSAILEFMQKE